MFFLAFLLAPLVVCCRRGSVARDTYKVAFCFGSNASFCFLEVGFRGGDGVVRGDESKLFSWGGGVLGETTTKQTLASSGSNYSVAHSVIIFIAASVLPRKV